MIKINYQVAGHLFRLSFPQSAFGIDSLGNYAPFRVREADVCLFHLTIVDDLPTKRTYEQVGQFDDDIASIGVFKSSEGYFRFRIAHPVSDDYCLMDTDATFN